MDRGKDMNGYEQQRHQRHVERIAELCHEANRTLCYWFGDEVQDQWDCAPDWQKESCIAGVRAHMYRNMTPRDSHEEWMKHKIANGWTFGEVKDAEKKTHPCLVSYDLLPPRQRMKDYLFRGICQAVIAGLKDKCEI